MIWTICCIWEESYKRRRSTERIKCYLEAEQAINQDWKLMTTTKTTTAQIQQAQLHHISKLYIVEYTSLGIAASVCSDAPRSALHFHFHFHDAWSASRQHPRLTNFHRLMRRVTFVCAAHRFQSPIIIYFHLTPWLPGRVALTDHSALGFLCFDKLCPGTQHSASDLILTIHSRILAPSSPPLPSSSLYPCIHSY